MADSRTWVIVCAGVGPNDFIVYGPYPEKKARRRAKELRELNKGWAIREARIEP